MHRPDRVRIEGQQEFLGRVERDSASSDNESDEDISLESDSMETCQEDSTANDASPSEIVRYENGSIESDEIDRDDMEHRHREDLENGRGFNLIETSESVSISVRKVKFLCIPFKLVLKNDYSRHAEQSLQRNYKVVISLDISSTDRSKI